MSQKIFTNHALATKLWKTIMYNLSVIIGGAIIFLPLIVLLIISCGIFIVTLGHVNFVWYFKNYLDNLCKYIDKIIDQ